MDGLKRFKDGLISVDDDTHSGRPSTLTDDAHVTKVNEIVRSKRRLTVRKITEDCKISDGLCHEMLVEKLEMHHFAAKFIPTLMSQDKKDIRVTICQELLNRTNGDEMLMKQIITSAKTWVNMVMVSRQKSNHHRWSAN